MTHPKKLSAHLFICTNLREPNRASCGQKRSRELKQQLKQYFKKPEFLSIQDRLRVNESGCLGRCEKGIVAVLYPEGKWFENLTQEDFKQLQIALECKINK